MTSPNQPMFEQPDLRTFSTTAPATISVREEPFEAPRVKTGDSRIGVQFHEKSESFYLPGVRHELLTVKKTQRQLLKSTIRTFESSVLLLWGLGGLF